MEAGDALWVAQQRGGGGEVHTLDTLVERKRADDLVGSIKDGRYERQRYFLARCGMRRTIYLVEGDVDLVAQVKRPACRPDVRLRGIPSRNSLSRVDGRTQMTCVEAAACGGSVLCAGRLGCGV